MADTLYHEFGNRWERPGSVAATDFVPMLVTVAGATVQSFVPLSMLPGGSGGTTGTFDVVNANIVTANTIAGNLNGTGSGTFNGNFTGTLVSNQLAASRVLFVDSSGSDSTGARGSSGYPFLTPGAARAAASSGDTIVVRPGGYAVAASLAKNGVNWHFMPGTTVTFTAGSSVGVWDDGGSAMTFRVGGRATFTRLDSDGQSAKRVVVCSHAGSVIAVQALDLLCGDPATEADGGDHVIHCAAGSLTVDCRDVLARAPLGAGNGAAVWWGNGSLVVNGRRAAGGQAGVWSDVTATPTGECDLRFAEIQGDSYGVYDSGTDTTAAFWVRANRVKGQASVAGNGASRVYVEAQKCFGYVNAGGSLLYVRADKVSPDAGALGNPLFIGAAGTSFVAVNHWDVVGVTGGDALSVSGGTHDILGGKVVGTPTRFTVSGGTANLRGITGTTMNRTGGSAFHDGATTLTAYP